VAVYDRPFRGVVASARLIFTKLCTANECSTFLGTPRIIHFKWRDLGPTQPSALRVPGIFPGIKEAGEWLRSPTPN